MPFLQEIFMKKLCAYFLGSILSCHASKYAPGTRAREISLFFIHDITRIIKDYDTDSCLEAHSKNYHAYVQNAHRWNSKIVLYDHGGIKVKQFYAGYVRAIALAPEEDMMLILHESFVLGYFSPRLLTLAGIALNDGTYAHGSCPGGFIRSELTYRGIEATSRIAPSIPLIQEPFYSDEPGFWPDISHAPIKQLRIEPIGSLVQHINDVLPAPYAEFVVELYDPVHFPNHFDLRHLSHQTTRTLKNHCFIGELRDRIESKRNETRRWALENPCLARLTKYYPRIKQAIGR